VYATWGGIGLPVLLEECGEQIPCAVYVIISRVTFTQQTLTSNMIKTKFTNISSYTLIPNKFF
jgi:hypothetical protein